MKLQGEEISHLRQAATLSRLTARPQTSIPDRILLSKRNSTMMATLELTSTELRIHLKLWEKLMAMHSSIAIPLGHIRDMAEVDRFRGSNLGIRAPGTGIPGVIHVGTYYKNGDVQFVFWTREKHCLVIELENERWARIIHGVEDAQRVAAEIHSAIGR